MHRAMMVIVLVVGVAAVNERGRPRPTSRSGAAPTVTAS